ncbi:hypothetical protein [Cupriavidus basilensis]|uniref:hypothetical protein n=1 Tax=Cupriavidus basilensis TaxID=68895 RepID=UPI0023E84671|nr:hypothetical protein [Cupriavidus basilensis]
MDKLRITVPGSADHYVELRLRDGTISRKFDDLGHGSYKLKATGFDEVIIARGDTILRLRCDARIPAHVPMFPSFSDTSLLIMDSWRNAEPLTMDEAVELQLHLSTPLGPLECGVWVRLKLEARDGKLAWVDSTGFKEGCRIVLPDAEPDRADDEKTLPRWFLDTTARWTVKLKRWRAKGNRLLSFTDGQNEQANLVDIDPERQIGGDTGSASLSLYLEPRDKVFEVCTELSLSAGFARRVPVSGYALQLEADKRASAPFVAQGLRLRCVQQEARDGWMLYWVGLPGCVGAAADSDLLALESLTRALLDQHAPGLGTVRSRNRLSMIPSRICTEDPQATIDLEFLVTALKMEQLPLTTRMNQLRLTAAMKLRLHFGGALDEQGNAMQLTVLASAYSKQAARSGSTTLANWTLSAGGAPAAIDAAANPSRLGIGSVQVTLAGFTRGQFEFGISSAPSAYQRAALVSAISLDFDKADYTALSMDPELGFETLSESSKRVRPWAVDLSGTQSCNLNISESASQEQSRSLAITLSLPTAGKRQTDVVVIDPSPLSVVRLVTHETDIKGGETLAEYIDDADQAPEWQFYSIDGEMTAILPPQGIGEEMIKGYLHVTATDGITRIPVPEKDNLFDFRLTPVARLTLDRTDVDMARSEAPWSLRRLLGRRLGTTGLKLNRAEFELLYGLSAKLESSGLRIAELDGFIGRIPFAEALGNATRKRDASAIQQAARATAWIGALWQRPSWWRIYTDLADRHSLLVDRGIEYKLRPSRETAHPFDIAQPATTEGGTSGRPPLRGGVDWPFQSRNIYDELKPQEPTVSSGGSIEGLVFGTLGGEGAQTAAFNNGKTLIITSSRQGRIDSLTLIRVGRIAMLWNKARHVIVYERTTKRADRYDDENGEYKAGVDNLECQPEFGGLAALRKVREYVEITEARRSYPDSRTSLPISGPLTQSVFTSTVIPVRADWGRDIKDGFVIALRGPIPAQRESFFPDPQVFLDFGRAKDKGGGSVGQRIRNTNRLIFFTSTRAGDGGDTDQWPAWPEVDFPLIRPAPPPELPFSSSFRGKKRQPDAMTVELGMAPFTFSLEPAEEAANLLHGRPVAGLESKIFNINLARGLPAVQPPVTTPAQLNALAASERFGEVNAVLLDGLAELRTELSARLQAGESFKLADRPELQRDIKTLLARLQTSVSGTIVTSPPANARDWEAQQLARLEAYKQGVANEALRLGDQLRSQTIDGDMDVARGKATAIVDAACKQAQQRISEVGFVPMLALTAAKNGLAVARHRLEGDVLGMALQAVQLLDDLERRYKQDPNIAPLLDGLWREAIDALPAKLCVMADNLGRLLAGEISEWFSREKKGGTNTLYDIASGGAAAQLVSIADWLARWTDTLPPFDLEVPDFQSMRDTMAAVLSPALAEDLLKAAVDKVEELVADAQGWIKSVDGAVENLRKAEQSLALRIANAQLVKELRDLLLQTADDIGSNLGKIADSVAHDITDTFSGLKFLDMQGALEGLKDFQKTTQDAISDLENQLGADLVTLEAAVREKAEVMERTIQASARQVEDWVSTEVGSAYQIARDNLDAGLNTLRVLAEGPVTDAMRSTRERIGYYMHDSELGVALTRASAVFNELQGDVLNALNINMPFDRLTDRLKACVDGMMVRDLFPRLAGIDMTYLLPDLNVPVEGDHQYEWLRLQHGFDKDRLQAWAKVSINKRFESDATLFDLGSVKLRLLRPLFVGNSDIAIGKDGQRTQRTSATLNADFEMSLNNHPMVTLRNGTLSFNESGRLDFDIEANNIELAAELKFISEAVQKWKPEFDGFTLTPLLPAGVSSSLALPLPDIGTGAFTLTGISLNSHLDLRIADGFEIATGLWLSKPDRPFGLAILFLGGGGWFGIDASYRPPSRFTTRVSVGISAGAFIAVNFGFASGSAGILFTASVDFSRDWQTGSGSTAIAVGLLIWGEFSVLGIASASVRVTLRITYTDDGGMRGIGQFSVSIKICWCYTLRVNRQVTKNFVGGGSGSRTQGTGTERALHRQLKASVAGPEASLVYAALRDRARPSAAVAEYLETLAIVNPS